MSIALASSIYITARMTEAELKSQYVGPGRGTGEWKLVNLFYSTLFSGIFPV